MLSDTYTLNVGSPAADVVFGLQWRGTSAASFAAPSSQGELSLRPILRVSHETTKANVVRSLVQFKLPVYDPISSDPIMVQCNMVLSRPLSATTADAETVLEMLSEFLTATVRGKLASMEA